MSSYRPLDSRVAANSSYRPLPKQARNDHDDKLYDRMYDERHSRSHSRDRKYSSPRRRRSPSHEPSRTPPRGPAADMKYNGGRNHETRERGTGGNVHHDNARDEFQREYEHRSSPSPPRRGRPHYRDRDREGYRSPGYDSRSRSRSPRRDMPYTKAPPSKDLILEGLPVDMVEEDISRELKQGYNVEGLEDVTVIRDHHTKKSRQFGFLRFAGLEESRAFLERNSPAIYLYGSSSDSNGQVAKVKIAYSRERGNWNREKDPGDWTCRSCTTVNYTPRTVCIRCQAVKTEMTAYTAKSKPQSSNTGDNDASPDNIPSQFLLLRGLEPTVTEELLAKGVAKLYKPSANSTQSSTPANAKKGAKVASTTGDANLGAKEGSIRRVLLVRDRRSNDSWRYGFAEFATVDDAQAALTRFNSFEKFTISSKPVLASYIHAGVFVPVLNPTASTERFTFSPLTNPSAKLAYWDDSAYVTELVVSKPETGNGNAKGKSQHAAVAGETEGLVKAGKDIEKLKKRKAELIAISNSKKESAATSSTKKAAPSHLEFWSNRHAELHGIEKKAPETEEDAGDDTLRPKKPKTEPTQESTMPTQSYADLNKMCCYLCSRQFKTEAEVHKHERLSQLHQDNLKNEELIAKAVAKLEKAQQPTTEYRDRAKERRQAYGLPKKASKPSEKAAAKDEEENETPTVPSKGASLLGKMGWSAGSGLGAQGTGMTAPISQDVYVQGVGLGAQGGKLGDAVEEAERQTKGGYGGFLEKTKEGARERFERLG